MIISLYPLRYDKYTSRQQREKVIEEIRELEEAANLEDIAEEAFDVMQALTGYLITLGVDLPRANRRHINKLRRRENER
jgi:NTP pyrophosphatase (non-canonical NTP hydrolase)